MFGLALPAEDIRSALEVLGRTGRRGAARGRVLSAAGSAPWWRVWRPGGTTSETSTSPTAADLWRQTAPSGGSPVSWSYPVFIMDLERYLVSEGGDNRVVGDEINLEMDAARYLPDVKLKFQPQPEIEATGEPGKNEATPAEQNLGTPIMQPKDNRLVLH